MRAMILTAGLGTRLRPLTDTLPKPLVPVAGRPMIHYVLDFLAAAGFTEILINVHYHAALLEEFARNENKKNHAYKIFVQDEKAEILGSGGAIAKAKPWLFAQEQTALVCNADTILQPDIADLIATHKRLVKEKNVSLTLAAMPHKEAGIKYNGLRCAGGLVKEFVKASPACQEALHHFPGLYMIEKSAADRLPNGVSSILEVLWMPLAKEKHLGAWEYRGIYQDLGSVADLAAAEKLLSKN